MKKSIRYFGIALLLTSLSTLVTAQDCEAYFPMQEGAFMEMKNYDKKGKLTSITQYTVLKKEVTGNRTSVAVKINTFDDKEEPVMDGEMEMYCEDGIFYIDMEKFLDEQMMQSFEGMELSVEAENLDMPSGLRQGTELKDGYVKVSIASEGVSFMTLTVNINNRKVEGTEEITTPAGTFSCVKISYDVVVKSIMKVSSKGIDWYAKDVGVVRSETYRPNGKLTGYSIMTDLKINNYN
ncbi:MAG: hypothetical protein KAT48_10235 [Bacteroidales bacterium]|nr:hypothetical protein [Bacteroidales bacterium]